jgi:DNA ligase-4
VLKGCDDPYFSFKGTKSFIKLKKDYIPGLGDTADFAIIGAHRDARDEQELMIGKLWWTTFYIGCLENKEAVHRLDAKPRFRIIDTIDRRGISKEDMLYLNRHGYFEEVPFAKSIPEFDVGFEHGRQLQPAELFKRPFSVELMGASFDKPANTRYFTLRFPRVSCRSCHLIQSLMHSSRRACSSSVVSSALDLQISWTSAARSLIW